MNALRKLKPIEERDPYAAACLDAFDRLESGRPMASEQPQFKCDDFAYSLGSMIEANRDDADICAWLREAKIGDEFQAGGGAAPEIVIRRVA